MTDARDPNDPRDEALIQHYRQNSAGEPPAFLDTLILNAARREAPAPRPSLWQRWVRLCQQPRWQMAFASVAGVALLVGVITRTTEFDQVQNTRLAAPATFSAPAPMSAPPRVESFSAEMNSDALPQGKLAKRAVPDPLEQGLQEVLRLRAAGDDAAATAKLAELRKRFPAQDLEERLKALQPH
ncbi:hypothetical protein C4J93_0187 [Pseudomonas sp. R2-37-08W]|uniref:hypothetical protein n=1 Tax=Pseudomonas sp. R2-37-08W TaxID=1173273 RepID=UPI000F57C9E3|nr:hypothetical protein [Pseudomonas sp. R2-37-08W]AZF08418.1 hypothetical protein C4J93_0187 [Pseudomonas sp. R2-37-08W]